MKSRRLRVRALFRTSIVGGSGGTGFQQDKRMNDPSMDWMNSKSTRKEFFDNLEQQYTYFCYGKGNRNFN